jgi:hypothetical protein
MLIKVISMIISQFIKKSLEKILFCKIIVETIYKSDVENYRTNLMSVLSFRVGKILSKRF